MNSDFDPQTIQTLICLYGCELDRVLGIARRQPALAAALTSEGELPAQVVYAIREEMACTLCDVLLRRTGLGTLGHPSDAVLEQVAQVAAGELGWSDARIALELEDARASLQVPA